MKQSPSAIVNHARIKVSLGKLSVADEILNIHSNVLCDLPQQKW
jgi:hypothetical protein